ncbi:hypothetical protein [Burkholderia ubonensis]|uniref:hypothetical protein n=1 Tax=Burkholderia ubonensis TaxID=101571 RepID=UPI002ABE73B1|nr:hypothetical protein [Burkholderia ubonensis]
MVIGRALRAGGAMHCSSCASGHARLFRPAAGQPHFNAVFSALSPGSFESDASFFRTATRFYDFDEA